MFGKRTCQVLETLLRELEMNMANNYKDNAQEDFVRLEQEYRLLVNAGKLNGKQQTHYGQKIDELKEVLKGYTHKDQKAVW